MKIIYNFQISQGQIEEDLSSAMWGLSKILRKAGKPAEAESSKVLAIEAYKSLKREHPSSS